MIYVLVFPEPIFDDKTVAMLLQLKEEKPNLTSHRPSAASSPQSLDGSELQLL